MRARCLRSRPRLRACRRRRARATSAGAPRLAVSAIGALPSGEFYALGRDTEPPKAFSLEHWNDEQRESVGFHALPEWFCPGIDATPESEGEARRGS